MDKARRIGGRLRRIDLLMRYHLRSQEKGLIPPSQMRMIEFIEKNDGCTQAEVAEEMQVSPASVAQSLKRMEASNYVSRDVCKGNLRANSLHITEVGLNAAKNCRKVFDELESEMLSGFSEEEQILTYDLLSRIIGNLESADTGSMNNMELSKLLCSEDGGKE
ncbi:MAG: MarR family winged helix-turn-helix transcriptional regulator [Clostridiales bacterium]|nr:MarR family winged helix-turn-helix transcriptional regulator [Clostridiales bacterium]